jgi:hypothetical protein
MRLRHWLGTKEEMRRAPEGGMRSVCSKVMAWPLRGLCPETGCRRADGVCPLWPSAGIVLIDLLTLTLTRPPYDHLPLFGRRAGKRNVGTQTSARHLARYPRPRIPMKQRRGVRERPRGEDAKGTWGRTHKLACVCAWVCEMRTTRPILAYSPAGRIARGPCQHRGGIFQKGEKDWPRRSGFIFASN